MEIASWQLAGAIEAVRGHVPIENLASDALAKRLMEAIPLAPQADDDVVDAHICCDHEHLPDDRELALMAAFLRGMRWLGRDGQQRVRRWVDERFAQAEPPF